MTGHYEGGGYCWRNPPKCWMCGTRDAVYITNSVTLCDDPECHIAFAEQEYDRIEFVEDKEEDGDRHFDI